MQILGINWDHPSGATLLRDDTVVASVSEERFSRKKNDISFPKGAIDYCVALAGGADKIDEVAVASLQQDYAAHGYQYSSLPLSAQVREQHEVWRPRLYEGRDVSTAEVMKEYWVSDQYPQDYWKEYDPAKADTFVQDSLDIIAAYVGVPVEKVRRHEHHWCHAYYAYYASPFVGEDALILTIDGHGDGNNATVATVRDGGFERLMATNNCALGRIYSHVTLLMGMKRLEHEYKVMGLAPYGSQRMAQPAYDFFREILEVDGLSFRFKNKPQDSYFAVRDKLEGVRFDLVAAGMQRWVEDVLCEWTEQVVAETGLDTVVISGGTSMNVKAMGRLGELPGVRRLFVPGSGSDDSICIGAALSAAIERSGQARPRLSVPSLYLGPEPDDVAAVTAEARANSDVEVRENLTPAQIAELLAKGIIFGRCIGRMEFGQRALGNRSILADPTSGDVVPRINAMIKQRDFWMPFAPVVMDTFAEDYVVNPKKLESPHMTLGFPSTPKGFDAMRAACHPADKTARAQILTREANPPLYELLEAFAAQTGRGALLNTSFNLHGYPIVNTAAEAYDVFLRSELEGLILDGVVFLKRSAVEAL